VRAYENEVCIAMANWAGPTFKGHSMTINADGTLFQLGGQDEQIMLATFDMSELRKIREKGIYGLHHRQIKAYGPLVK
jgi:predicted amidohydrolase